jgi:hypothetical protein
MHPLASAPVDPATKAPAHSAAAINPRVVIVSLRNCDETRCSPESAVRTGAADKTYIRTAPAMLE